MLHGKIKHYQLFSENVEGWTAAVGGGLIRTFDMLPPKVPGTNIRNYLIGLLVNYQFVLTDNAAAPRVVVARTVHQMCGGLAYKDGWGMMLPPILCDDLVASNLSEGIMSPDKTGLAMGFASGGAAAQFTINHNVFVAYAPKMLADKRHASARPNGVFPCSLLGQLAEIQFGAVGVTVDQDLVCNAAPLITITAICWQSKELIVPAPTQIHSQRILTTQDPYIEEGEPRKIEDMLVMDTIVEAAPFGFWTSAGNLTLDFDGNQIMYGPCWQLMDSTHLQRNHEHGFRGINDPGNAAAVAGIVYDDDFYQGNAATLLDADGFELSTQGRTVRRMELGGTGVIEARHGIRFIQRKRFECDQRLFEQWCEREGIPVAARKDIRIGGAVADKCGLSRGEAMGVQQTIGSRKERKP